jgi:hypothetical protein
MIGLVSVPTHSEDKAGATVDLIGEMIECAAYFRMTSGCLAKQPEEKAKQLAERYEQQAVNMLGNAIQLGTPNGLTVDGAAAFLKSMATSMDEAMGGHRETRRGDDAVRRAAWKTLRKQLGKRTGACRPLPLCVVR